VELRPARSTAGSDTGLDGELADSGRQPALRACRGWWRESGTGAAIGTSRFRGRGRGLLAAPSGPGRVRTTPAGPPRGTCTRRLQWRSSGRRRPALERDEAEALLTVEPLHSSLRHASSSTSDRSSAIEPPARPRLGRPHVPMGEARNQHPRRRRGSRISTAAPCCWTGRGPRPRWVVPTWRTRPRGGRARRRGHTPARRRTARR
jgi:hypothetical protein